jgi:hypothetical protein
MIAFGVFQFMIYDLSSSLILYELLRVSVTEYHVLFIERSLGEGEHAEGKRDTF